MVKISDKTDNPENTDKNNPNNKTYNVRAEIPSHVEICCHIQ